MLLCRIRVSKTILLTMSEVMNFDFGKFNQEWCKISLKSHFSKSKINFVENLSSKQILRYAYLTRIASIFLRSEITHQTHIFFAYLASEPTGSPLNPVASILFSCVTGRNSQRQNCSIINCSTWNCWTISWSYYFNLTTCILRYSEVYFVLFSVLWFLPHLAAYVRLFVKCQKSVQNTVWKLRQKLQT